MKRKIFYLLTINILLTVVLMANGFKANYKLANRFSPHNLKKMVFSTYVNPNWLKNSNKFWYSYETTEGKNYYIVDPERGTKKLLFDNDKMASLLTEIIKDPYDAKHLPIKKIKFFDNERFWFEVKSTADEVLKEEETKQENEKTKKSKESKKEKVKKKTFYFEYNIKTGKLKELKDFEKPKDRPKWANISPDGNKIVFVKHHNLYWMDKENYQKALEDEKDSTIVEHQITTDGEEFYCYADDSYITNVDREKKKDDRKPVYIVWSKDSKKFAVIRTDERKVKDLWVINSIASPRPTLETYKYIMPGEENAPIYELYIFDTETWKRTKVKAEEFKDQTISVIRESLKEQDKDNDWNPSIWLTGSSKKLYFQRTSRDLKRIDICEADTETGEVKVLIKERLNTYVETRPLVSINGGKEFIHWSERDGWAHFYLYNSEGKLKNRITKGPWHCERVLKVDAKNRVMYFLANGKEKDEDPYYLHLYRVNLDGSGLKLLDKKNFNHYTRMDDNCEYFVDTYSRVNTIPVTELRDNEGNLVLELEEADLSSLFAAGYKFPEPFKVKAADGITDIYGVMYKPFDFDSTKKYPIIEYVYPGPQTEAVNKSFSTRMNRTDRMAQLGFIVITLGNRGGHPARSKWYHNYGYGNLRDYGLADKKYAAEQLADKYKFIDIERVGIFGHSGGGFMSTAAMLVYPDFFKVAVSSSGNHDNRVYNRWWSEKHHGVKEKKMKDGEIKFLYDIETNPEIAKNLKGHLMITTGDIDDNVHPANTIRLANALIKANKRFDFFLFPGQKHGYGNMTEYFFWLKADYFSKYLLGDGFRGVDIKEMNNQVQKTGNNKRK